MNEGGRTPFDRAMALLDLPDVLSTAPSTIIANNALLGHGGTHIVHTAKHREEGFTIFLQVLDISGSGVVTQVVLPDKVCRAIYRQRQSLIDRSRRKPRAKLTREERDRKELADARRVIRQHRNR